uniref:Uncharacterized protein n=1 Tax=Caenorhabditis japonica TaxID=281687 RepID=A0A8R1IH48_CAEJA
MRTIWPREHNGGGTVAEELRHQMVQLCAACITVSVRHSGPSPPAALSRQSITIGTFANRFQRQFRGCFGYFFDEPLRSRFTQVFYF